LRIKEASLSSGDLSITDTLSNLGVVQRTRHEYELSLTYELNCFSIREKVLPPDHQDIGKSLFNIGTCCEYLNQLKLAFDYYQRALVVYEQCLPFLHEHRKKVESKIKELSEKIQEMNI
jgi:tetratricopeptide (TPR) repeat protein